MANSPKAQHEPINGLDADGMRIMREVVLGCKYPRLEEAESGYLRVYDAVTPD